ncbi:hypothetical protein AAur_2844 [Paenarthrobacter aurescens TC1]|uniref:Uncharacterized protein n=1 Tax=Paenarthrobacter aurescens (strain TC1) TaxID=290340 RepID=A1R8J2_PAEAT|nr:hypothetical protein AAur_2844 [Paenarthrobacter aurescens TC1]
MFGQQFLKNNSRLPHRQNPVLNSPKNLWNVLSWKTQGVEDLARGSGREQS